MEKYTGKSVLKGIAIGRIYWYQKQDYQVVKTAIDDKERERRRFESAVEQAKMQLGVLYDKALASVGEDHAMIFDIHRMMLEDEDYLDAIKAVIEEGWNAEYAVDTAEAQFSEMFAAMDDDYMKARAVDIHDISKRVIRILAGILEDGILAEDPVIVVADDLTPSETVKMDKNKILAFVTLRGSANSHTAILARSMNLPALVNTQMKAGEELNGKIGVVDGFNGEFLIEPKQEILDEMILRKNQWVADLEALEQLKGQDNVTKDGRRIDVFANIGKVEDADGALSADAGGIGLFRSEFLYLGRDTFPTEEEQFVSYKTVLEKMQDKKVVIRTLDIGADKKVDYFKLEEEENPALGYRAIRICLDRPEIFMTQLRAIYRASAYGRAAIMFPMVVSVNEVRRIKEIVEQVRAELTTEGYPMKDVELGIMIETPAAALISDELAKEVDFFSIGTNDLTQYTLAVDRQNQKLEGTCDTHHPAVLKLIEMTVTNAHQNGIWAGICGELAADTDLTETFLDMGVDELSVSASSVLKVRKAVRDIS
ncbi:MAG: phosphoenolpyruvate--protein phosphotransferase [Blautia sp.]|nr:phosphoenolpyruvate--protein phosphotransferase [Lachnoclostridium sp.]MCM1211234.1 phosphoenolpyruvate--protein phosphotransferase [Blautia sp.]